MSKILFALLVLLCGTFAAAQTTQPAAFHVLVMTETGGVHGPFVEAAKTWLAEQGKENGFTLDYIENADKINDAFLSHYQVFLQLNYPPYAWNETAFAAFEKAIRSGSIGWVGLHHASLLGDFDGYKLWPWFDDFMGGIIFKSYIPKFAKGTLTIEAADHPIFKGVTSPWVIQKEEFYTYDKSPRPNVHVLASVDESTYEPSNVPKMGDHPVIWSNEKYKARNVYIFMGHSPVLFDDANYKTVLKNAILWAAGK